MTHAGRAKYCGLNPLCFDNRRAGDSVLGACALKVAKAAESRKADGSGQLQYVTLYFEPHIVQELCESRGGRPGLSVLTSLLVSVDIKLY